MGHSFSINGQDMSAYGVTVPNHPAPFAPATDLDLIRMPNTDRSIASEPFAAPRRIAFDAIVSANTFALLRTALDNIAAHLDIRDLADLALDSWPDRYWRVWRQASTDATITGCNARLPLEFIAPEAAAYSTTASTATATFPAAESLPVTVGGTARAWPEIVFTAAGAAGNVIIEHSDLDIRMSWTGSLATGNRLKFDTHTWEVFWTAGIDDDWELSMSGFVGEFPHLFPGVNNLRLLTPSAGTLTASWRARYL